jgi:2-keto-4-pentenoate hydratase
MTMVGPQGANPRLASIAEAFVAARRSGAALPDFPGIIPDSLAAAYACQDAAIALWDDEIVGWKVGGVPQPMWHRFGTTRVAGPIFRRGLRQAGGMVEYPVFVGGFAAVEAEFAFRLERDAPADQLDWTDAEALALVGDVHISVETAGSPLATINELGSIVVASDFGNNAGLILGPGIGEWRDRAFETRRCRTLIEGSEVGRGSAGGLAGGAVESLRFLLENCARRGRPLKAGMLVASGAVTGVHDIKAGQSAHVDFGDFGAIDCRAIPYQAG